MVYDLFSFAPGTPKRKLFQLRHLRDDLGLGLATALGAADKSFAVDLHKQLLIVWRNKQDSNLHTENSP